MKIYPAIDIINGSVVRLTRGVYGDVKKYGITPAEAAESFAVHGAKYLHIVDLDGAKSGKAENAEKIGETVKASGLSVEIGGGIRTMGQAEEYLSRGADRVIIGTAAVKDPGFLREALRAFGDRVAVGIDAKDGYVAVSGWEEVTELPAVEFCRRLEDIGVRHIIYTDISRDGTLSGTNLDVYRVLHNALTIPFTASGGITSAAEITELKAIGADAAVLGKALYENAITLEEALGAAEDDNAG